MTQARTKAVRRTQQRTSSQTYTQPASNTAQTFSPTGCEHKTGATKVDSGYSTQNCDTAKPISLQPASIFSAISTKLGLNKAQEPLRFERQPTTAESNRYCDLLKILGPGLSKVVTGRQPQCSPCAARLRFYGPDEESSRPCLVILCDKSVSRQVRKFLNEQVNKDQIYARHARDDRTLPSFEVLVEDHSPTLLNDGESESVEVLIKKLDRSSTLCGARLRSSGNEPSSIATLGGIIAVQQEGRNVFYGLTVAHLVTGGDLPRGTTQGREDESGSGSTGSSDADCDEGTAERCASGNTNACHRCVRKQMPCSLENHAGSEEFLCLQCHHAEVACGTGNINTGASNNKVKWPVGSRPPPRRRSSAGSPDTFPQPIAEALPMRSLETFQKPSTDSTNPSSYKRDSQHESWIPFGCILKSWAFPQVEDPPSTGVANLDWALVKLHDETLLKPNKFYRSDADSEAILISKVFERPGHQVNVSDTIEVSLISGTNKSGTGNLSLAPNFLLLPPSNDFVKVYTLRTTGNQDLETGDCGAWVLCSATHEVIGVVTARDEDGDIYVVPLEGIFKQIKDVLQASEVLLPSNIDETITQTTSLERLTPTRATLNSRSLTGQRFNHAESSVLRSTNTELDEDETAELIDRPWIKQKNQRQSRTEEELTCKSCGIVTKTPSDFKKHQARHEAPFKCDYENCPRYTRGFATVNDLYRHKKSVHGENARGSKYYKCFAPNCPKADRPWPRLDNFRQHLNRMHDDQDVDELIQRSNEWYEEQYGHSARTQSPPTPNMSKRRSVSSTPTSMGPPPNRVAGPPLQNDTFPQEAFLRLSPAHAQAFTGRGDGSSTSVSGPFISQDWNPLSPLSREAGSAMRNFNDEGFFSRPVSLEQLTHTRPRSSTTGLRTERAITVPSDRPPYQSRISVAAASWAEHEKIQLLVDMMRAGDEDVVSELLQIIRTKRLVPRWNDIGLPEGRSLRECQQMFDDLMQRDSSQSFPLTTPPDSQSLPPRFAQHSPYAEHSFVQPQPATRAIQPRPSPSYGSPNPTSTNEESLTIVSTVGPGLSAQRRKKRVRPTKEEVEECSALLAAEGKVYEPKKRPSKRFRAATGTPIPVSDRAPTAPNE